VLAEFFLPLGWHGRKVDGFNTCVVEFVVFLCVGNEQDLVVQTQELILKNGRFRMTWFEDVVDVI